MRGRGNPVLRLLQALALAATGFLLSAGAAMAHGGHSAGHSADHARPAPGATAAATPSPDAPSLDAVVDLAAAVQAATQPCDPSADDQAGGHHGIDCCAVGCHAALGAPVVGLLGSERPGQRLGGISDRLDSRLGDRTERPPKHG